LGLYLEVGEELLHFTLNESKTLQEQLAQWLKADQSAAGDLVVTGVRFM